MKDEDLDRELLYHLESLADGFERQGMTRAEALARARREFGGVEPVKERCRDERGEARRLASGLRQDLAFGFRMLRKTPAVTAAAILSLALGIGATTAILSLVDAVLWRTLAVPHPEQLTEFFNESKGRHDLSRGASGSNFPDGPLQVADYFSQPAYEAMRRQAAGKAEVAAHLYPNQVSTSFGGVTAVAKLRPVSGNFFPLLRVAPFAGRLLVESDDSAAAPLAILVSHHYWQTALGGQRDAIGRSLRMNNRDYTIAGVLPAGFGGISVGDTTDLYTTIPHSPGMLDPEGWLRKRAGDPRVWHMQLLARRAPGVTEAELRPLLDSAFRSTWAAPPKDPATAPRMRLVDASNGLGGLRRQFRDSLYLLFALVGLVLLIACANIANLLLARADSRRKEVALRISLGCSRARLVRQFFTESVLLAVIGGALSLAVAYATARFSVSLIPAEDGLLRVGFQLDPRTLLATLGVTLLTALVFGLYPAVRATRVNAAPALKEGAGSVGSLGGRGWLAPGKLLVFAQVAFGVLLLGAAVMFSSHLRKILSAETGFDRTRLLLFDLRPGQAGHQGPNLRQFYFDLERGLRELPGVDGVGLAMVRPMRGGGQWDDIKIDGEPKEIPTAMNMVTSGYLRALGVPLVAGRDFTPQDILSDAAVAIVSEDTAKAMSRPALGATFKLDKETFQIVGIAARARYERLTRQPKVVYLPNRLKDDMFTAVVRTSVPPMQVVDGVRRAVSALDRNLPLADVFTMEDQIAAVLRRERLFAWLCGAFGLLALVLCMVGLYGVMSYATARRSQEIGIRMALGASPRDVLRHILGEGMSVALAGLVLGAPAAWWAASKFMDYKRMGMEPVEPAVIAWAAAALAGAALLAVLAPAVRAAGADPVKALRQG